MSYDHINDVLQWLLSVKGVLAGVCGVIYSFIYRRYVDILGGGKEPADSLERRAYDSLRASLAGGGSAARLYAHQLTIFLDRIDRLLGDIGTGSRMLFANAIGLRTPVPLWTAPALDRCLLVAFIYPVATIFVIWVLTGHVGPAEDALHLTASLAGWQRGLAAVAACLLCTALWRSSRASGLALPSWLAIAITATAAVALAVSAAFGVVLACGALAVTAPLYYLRFFSDIADVPRIPGVLAVFTGVLLAVDILLEYDAGGAGAAAIVLEASAWGLICAAPVALVAGWGAWGEGKPLDIKDIFFRLVRALCRGAVGFAVAFIFCAVWHALDRSTNISLFLGVFLIAFLVSAVVLALVRRSHLGVFLGLAIPAMILSCFIAAKVLAHLDNWERGGPLLLFLGLLTLLNAPFSWASVGLTRALMRGGLELGGWWPYLLALTDALLSPVIVVIFAVTIVVGVQTYDYLAVHGGGSPVLPLDQLFDGISTRPSAPEYWWIYTLLLSALMPSLINLMIGAASFIRWAPLLPTLLLRFMPDGRAVPSFNRPLIAHVLTVQVVGGFVLGFAAQAFLVVIVVGYVMPWLGLELLEICRSVSAFNLPGRIMASLR